jgi:hypothetical protein
MRRHSNTHSTLNNWQYAMTFDEHWLQTTVSKKIFHACFDAVFQFTPLAN